MSDAPAVVEGWAILELMGRRRVAGVISEQLIAGAPFLRIDVPGPDGAMMATQLYAASAVYAITPTTEEVARAAAATNQRWPISRWELPPAPVAETPPPSPTPDADHIWQLSGPGISAREWEQPGEEDEDDVDDDVDDIFDEIIYGPGEDDEDEP